MPITNNVILANSSGSVGIGTYSPTVKLDVSGSAKFTVGVNGTVDITNSGAITLRNQIGAEGRFGTFSNHDLVLTTNNTSRLTIAAAGNVGINTTSPTLATLQVQGNIWAQSFTGSFSGSSAAPGLNTQVIFNSSGSLAASSGFIFDGASVGIGVTNPQAQLQVGSKLGSGLNVYSFSGYKFGVENGTSRFIGPEVTGSNQTVVIADYLLGASAAWGTGTGLITFSSRDRGNNVDGGTIGYVGIIKSTAFNSTGSGNLVFGTAPSTANTSTERMRITSDGNVGIGSTTVPSKLYVELSGAANQRLANFRNIGGNSFIEIQSSGTGAIGFWTAADNSFSIYQNATAGTIGTSVLYVSSSTNVGIGTTAPGDKLTVYGAANAPLGTRIINATNGTAAYSYLSIGVAGSAINIFSYPSANSTRASTAYINTDSSVTNGLLVTTDAGPIRFSAASTAGGQLYINTSGNVGIGTTSPTAQLEIKKSAQAVPNILLSGPTNYDGSDFKGLAIANYFSDGAANRQMVVYNPDYLSYPYLRFVVANLSYASIDAVSGSSATSKDLYLNGSIYITSGSNVGIGTTNPVEKLDVNGKVKVGTRLALSPSVFGYNSTWKTLILGSTGSNYLTDAVTMTFGVDVSSNPGGSYTGDGRELIFRNFTSFITPNEANTDYRYLMQFNSGSVYLVPSFGNVGIGTTAPGAKLTVRGGNIDVQESGYGLVTNELKLADYNTGIFTDGTNGNMTFSTYGGGTGNTFRWVTNVAGTNPHPSGGTTRMVMDKGGNVGIGTTTPAAKLDVVGSRVLISGDSASTGELSVYTGLFGSTASQRFLVSGSNIDVYALRVKGITGGNFNSTIYASIDNTGNGYFAGSVGIGTTTPIYKLQTSGISNFGDGPFVISGGSNSTGYYDQSAGAYFHVPTMMIRRDQAATSAAEMSASLVLYNKNGTNNTGNKLVFAANETTTTSANPVATAAIVSQKVSGTDTGWASGNLKFLVKSTSAYTDVMTMLSNGNVGIGSATPGTTLDVVGNVRAQSFTGSFSGSSAAPGSNTNVIYNSSGVLAGSNNFIFNGTNVGIGTISPVTTLHVSSSAAEAFRITGGTSVGLYSTFFNGTIAPLFLGFGGTLSSTATNNDGVIRYNASYNLIFTRDGSEAARFNSSGNLGIGTSVPTGALQVHGTLSISNNGVIGQGSAYGTSTAGSFTTLKLYDNSTGNTDLNNQSYNIQFQTAGSTKVYIKNDGNVGIGTTSPSTKLHIYEAGASDVVLRLTPANGTYDPLIQFTGQGNDIATEGFEVWYDNDIGDVHLSTTYANDAASIHFHTRTGASKSTSNERLTILGGGNVGIGITSPTVKLDVSGSVNVRTSAPTITFDRNGSYTWRLVNGDGVTYPLSTFNIGNNANTAIATFLDGGNVGIGTTDPGYKLHVYGSSGPTIMVQSANNIGGQFRAKNTLGDYIKGIEGSTTGGWMDYDAINSQYITLYRTGSAGSYSIYTNGGERIKIIGDGNVGIGTTSPITKLQINSSAYTGAGPGDSIRVSNNGSAWIAADNSGSLAYFGAVNITEAKFAGYNYRTGTNIDMILGQESMYIKANGNVGIGTTSPITKLEVFSTAPIGDRTLPHNVLTLTAEQGNAPYSFFGGAILFKNRSYVSGIVESSRIRSVIYDDGAPNNFGGGIWFETTPTPGGSLTSSLVLNYLGNVGIGTTVPAHKLDVVGNVNIPGGNYYKGAGVNLIGSDGTSNYINAAASLYFSQGAGYAMRLDGNGNLGIATTSPAYKLDVSGSVAIRQNKYFTPYKSAYIFARGWGYNSVASSIVSIDGADVLNTGGRGLHLVIINAATLAFVSSTLYDTYGSTADSDNLATAIGNMTSAQVGVLVSADAWELSVTANLRSAALKVGLTKLGTYSAGGARRPYAAIFNGSSDDANATTKHSIERMESDDADAPYANITTYLTTDGTYASIDGALHMPNALYSSDSNVEEPVLVVTSGANVGIGTISPDQKLVVLGNSAKIKIQTAADASYNTYIESNYDAANSFNIVDGGVYKFGSKALVTYNDTYINGYYNVYIATGTVTNNSASNIRLFVAQDGNVGIGTTNPVFKLDVLGTSRIVNSTLPFYVYSSGSDWAQGVRIGDLSTSNGYMYLSYVSASKYGSLQAGDNDAYRNIYINHQAGNVGIGTTTAPVRLNVNGAINAGTDSATVGTIIIQDQYTSGHLTVFGTNQSSGGPMIGYAVYPSSSINTFASSTTITIERSAFVMDSEFRWYTGGAQTLSVGVQATMTKRMSLSNAGALTIDNLAGTGDRIVGTNSSGVLSAITIGSGLSLSGGTLTATGGSAGTVTGGGANSQVSYWTSASNITGSAYFTYDATNYRIGIGTTTAPSYTLDIAGQAYIDNGAGNALRIKTAVADSNTRDAIYLYENDAQATGRQAISWYNGNTGYYKARIWTEVGSGYAATQFGIDVADDARTVATRLLIRNGNIGIGTTLPSYKLDVYGAGAVIRAQSNTTYTDIALTNTSATSYIQASTTNMHFFVNGGSTSDIVLSLDGTNDRVGIGITTPSYRLHVSGTAYINNYKSTGAGEALIVEGSGDVRLTNGGSIFWGAYSYASSTYIQAYDDQDGIYFYSNGTFSTFINSTGVGIGTSTPQSKLQIVNNVSGGGFASYGSYQILLYQAGSAANSYGIGIESNTMMFNSDNYYKFYVDNVAKVYIDNTGTITAAGDLIAYGSPSDITLKTNVKPLEGALEKITKLQGVSFTWKDSEQTKMTGLKDDIGFIAQEVKEILPELVRENDNGLLSLRDKGIVPYLVEAIKEQQKQIDELRYLLQNK